MAAPTPPPTNGTDPAQQKAIRFLPSASRLPPVRTIGQQRTPLDDVYHWILARTWLEFFGVVAASFVVLNSLFALLYLCIPGAITNLPPGSFEDAFYFSVQTLATIGYGVMAPATRAGHLLVAFEALVGMLSVALMTGITFAKFARPTARVLFADKVTITPRSGVPHLMFRMANWRGNQMVDAALKVILLVTDVTPEGETMRIPIEIPLVRDKTYFFILTWMPMHRIDEHSPFYGPDAITKLRAKKGEMFLSLTGYDETMGATVHTRKQYTLNDIVPNVRFADVLQVLDDGQRILNYHHFNELLPIGAPPSPPESESEADDAEPLAPPEPLRDEDLTASTVEALLTSTDSHSGDSHSGDSHSGDSHSGDSHSGDSQSGDKRAGQGTSSGTAP